MGLTQPGYREGADVKPAKLYEASKQFGIALETTPGTWSAPWTG